jgi:phospholipase D1/2
LFGLEGNVRPAKDLEGVIRMPGKPESWRKLQARAQANAAAYEATFEFVPRSWSPYRKNLPASIVPNWNPDVRNPNAKSDDGYPASPQPAEAAFWKEARHNPEGVGQLEKIQGFITALPIHWTEGENNRFPYPSSLVTQNELRHSGPGPSAVLAGRSPDKEDVMTVAVEDERQESA